MSKQSTPALAWVESPLQLIGAAEWAASHGEPVDLAVRLTAQMPETTEELIARRALFGIAEPYLGIPWRMLAGHDHWLVGDGFSGQFRLAASILRPRRITFLDDGANTFAYADALTGRRPYARPGVHERGITARIAPLALDRVRSRAVAGGVDLFTAFPLGRARTAALAELGIGTQRHSFEWLRATSPSRAVSRRLTAERVVLGSVRAIDARMGRDEYVTWLLHEAARGPAAYLPHRRETDEQLAAVREIPDLTVVELGVPVELALAGRRQPVEVVSLASSAMTTLPLVLRGTESMVVSRSGVPEATA